MHSSKQFTGFRITLFQTALLATAVAAASSMLALGDEENNKSATQADAPADKSFVETKTISVGPRGLLTVDADRGKVEVTTGDRDTVTLEVIRTVPGKYVHEAAEILKHHQTKFTQDGSNITVQARIKPFDPGSVKIQGLNLDLSDDIQRTMKQALNRRLRSVRFRISVPRNFSANLKTCGGSISIADLAGNVRCQSSGGSLKLGQIAGEVWAKTSGGCINLSGCRRDAELQTSGGSITVGDVAGSTMAHTCGGSIRIGRVQGVVSARTSGGGISIANAGGSVEATTSGGSIFASISEQPQDQCLLTTSGGSVHIKLARTLGLDIEASGQNGRVSAPFIDRKKDGKSKSVQHIKLNGGGPKLIARTTAGSVRFDYIDSPKDSPSSAAISKKKTR